MQGRYVESYKVVSNFYWLNEESQKGKLDKVIKFFGLIFWFIDASTTYENYVILHPFMRGTLKLKRIIQRKL